ncbi:hypothetical protein R1sor_022441 [Riccia sorocarpa]|uniref:C2 domain-containing protein n=1 Tax=Riccia sorocarpa TaxID=122646 RepID=A0ABD3GJU0_9MARC
MNRYGNDRFQRLLGPSKKGTGKSELTDGVIHSPAVVSCSFGSGRSCRGDVRHVPELNSHGARWRDLPVFAAHGTAFRSSVGTKEGSSHDPISSTVKVFGHGGLHVEIHRGRNLKGDEFWGMGKSDPYLLLRHGAGKGKTLKSQEHHNGGSNPQWYCKFYFPMRNGGCKEDNILEIEIYNKNTRFHREDNLLGHLRIEDLANWVCRDEHNITELAWYPVFYKRRRSTQDQKDEEKRGEILMRFYFQSIEENVFRSNIHTEPECSRIQDGSDVQQSAGEERIVDYRRVPGRQPNAGLGNAGAIAGITQAVIAIIGLSS